MSTEEEPRGRRGLPLLHKVLLALGIVLVGSEAGVRVADAVAGRDADFFLPRESPHLAVFETHPYMGFAYRAGASKESTLATGTQVYHINSLGMRGPEMAVEKPPGVYRILCLGGSTTFGTGATSDESTYPARLQAHLNAMAPPGVRYEVGNCGVNGYNTVENLIYLALRLVELDPDAIVIYQAANDARPIQARGFRPDYGHLRRSWVVTELSPTERWLLRNVRLYAWAARGLDPEEQLGALAHPLFVEDFKERHLPSDQGVPEEGLDVFFRNLGHMIAICRERDILAVLSTFAVCAEKQAGGERYLETVAAINARLPGFAEEKGVPLLLVAEQLDGRCELFDDWMHLNDAGSDAHGLAAAEEARRLGLFGL